MSEPTPRLPPASSTHEQPTVPPAPPGTATVPPDAPLDSATTLAPGGTTASPGAASVPGYQILGELGRGGMGVVYKARHLGLNRLCALKMILAGGHAGEADLARFRTEAEAVARLQHPNIVAVYDIGTHEGEPFLSLEFCPGGSLDRKLGGTPIDPREAAELVEVLAEAVRAAHEAKVIHRDLKPANVLLGADGTPKVTDFGLAKKLDDTSGQTQTGAVMGTPSYMAPEQAEGKTGELGPAVDVYALGAILYECVTGRPPFKAATSFDTILQVVSQEPVPPRQLNAKVPRDLETITLKCLRKDAGKRYASAGELGEDLGRYLAGEPVKARPVGPFERGAKWVRRRPRVATLLVAAALAAVAVLGMWFHFTVRLADQRSRLQEQRDSLEAVVYGGQVTLALQEWRGGDVEAALGLLGGCPDELRGWEHDHVSTLCQRKPLTWQAHARAITAACYSPDGSRLVTASSGSGEDGSGAGEVKVWGAQGGELLSFAVACGPVLLVAFSPDGGSLAGVVQLWDGEPRRPAREVVRVWDSTTGEQRLALPGFDGGTHLSFSPDGKRLAVSGRGGPPGVWEVATGKRLALLKGDAGAVRLCHSPDGALIAGAGGGVVRVWDARSGERLFSLKGHPEDEQAIAFTPEGRQLLTATAGLAVKAWDARTGRAFMTLEGRRDGAGAPVWFSPDCKRLAGLDGGTLRVWDTASRQETFAVAIHTEQDVGGRAPRGVCCCFSPDGNRVAVAAVAPRNKGRSGLVKVWDAGTGLGHLTLKGHKGAVTCLGCSPDGKLIFSAGADGDLRVWDAATGRALRNTAAHEGRVTALAVATSGPHVASGSDGVVKVWNSRAWQLVTSFKLHSPHQAVLDLSFSPDGAGLAVATNDPGKGVRVWDLATGGEGVSLSNPHANTGYRGPLAAMSGQASLKGIFKDDCKGVCFSPDGRRLVSAAHTVPSGSHVLGLEFVGRVWDATSGREVFALKGHPVIPEVVGFSADGERILTAGSDGTMKLWDAASGKEVRTLAVRYLRHAALNPDGTRLAVASGKAVTVWDARRGVELLSLRGHADQVRRVCFSPDGRILVSASDDGTVCVRHADAPLPTRSARQGQRNREDEPMRKQDAAAERMRKAQRPWWPW